MRASNKLHGSLFLILLATTVACGDAESPGDETPTLPGNNGRSGGKDDPEAPIPSSPSEPVEKPAAPVAFSIGEAVTIASDGSLPRGVTDEGDVILSRLVGDKTSYAAVPVKGGASTPIEVDLTYGEASVSGNVVEIRKAPPTQRTGQLSIWSRAGGLKSLGTTVRHYGAFAASPDGKRIAYVTSNGELKSGTYASVSTYASGIDTQKEDCTPTLEYAGDRLVSSLCTGGAAKGDLRAWDTSGTAKSLAASGAVGYTNFSFNLEKSHALFDSGTIGSPLSVVDLASGQTTTLDTGNASGAFFAAAAKLAVYRSSSRQEIRVWRNGQSSMLVDRASSFGVSGDQKWLVTTRTFPTPAKLLLVDLAAGTQTEIADDAYLTSFTGDSKRFLYRIGNQTSLQLWDIAAKSASPMSGVTSVQQIPGHAEAFTFECTTGAEYDAAACTLSVFDTATKSKKVVDTKVSRRFFLHKNAVVYVQDGVVKVRPVTY